MAVVSNWFLKDTNKYLEEKRLCIARIRCIIYQFGWRGLTHEVLSVTWYEAIKVEIFCSYHDGDFNHTARPLHAGEVMFTVCGAFGCAGNQFQQEVYGVEINCFTLPEKNFFFFFLPPCTWTFQLICCVDVFELHCPAQFSSQAFHMTVSGHCVQSGLRTAVTTMKDEFRGGCRNQSWPT